MPGEKAAPPCLICISQIRARNTFPRNAHQSVCTASSCPVHLPCALTLKGPLPTSPGGAARSWPPGSAGGILPCRPGPEGGGHRAWRDSRSLGGYPPGGTPGLEARALGHCAACKALYARHSFAMKTSQADGPILQVKSTKYGLGTKAVWTRSLKLGTERHRILAFRDPGTSGRIKENSGFGNYGRS